MTTNRQKMLYMRRALKLARRGAGFVSPNPMVGAVIVRGGKIVAEGYHHLYGGNHAEVDALKKIDYKASGCDMYLNLEPCSHHGKTPPCVDALISSKINAVYVGMIDPNPRVAGKGIKKLLNAGINVEVGILEKECREFNRSFIKHVITETPFVVGKAAITIDGKIATSRGDSGQEDGGMSGEASHRLVHRLRHELDAILVGAGTVIRDNPYLTARMARGRASNPLRVVLDGKGHIPLSSNVLDVSIAETIVVTTRASESSWREGIKASGAELWLMKGPGGNVDINELLERLGSRAASLIVEGGSQIFTSFMNAAAIDRFMFFMTPMILGGQEVPVVGGNGFNSIKDAWRLKDVSVKMLDGDLLYEGTPVFDSQLEKNGK